MKKFSKADYKSMPWKNGGGVTTELYRRNDGDNLILRLSVATVAADGPFSLFPGLRRHLVILDGEGVCLTIQNEETILTQDSPVFEFSGDLMIESKLLKNTVKDFNVMFTSSWATVITGKNSLPTGKWRELFIYDLKTEELHQYEAPEEIQSYPENYILIEII